MLFSRTTATQMSPPVSYTHLDVYKRQVWSSLDNARKTHKFTMDDLFLSMRENGLPGFTWVHIDLVFYSYPRLIKQFQSYRFAHVTSGLHHVSYLPILVIAVVSLRVSIEHATCFSAIPVEAGYSVCVCAVSYTHLRSCFHSLS